jgi:hypothetical protein
MGNHMSVPFADYFAAKTLILRPEKFKITGA